MSDTPQSTPQTTIAEPLARTLSRTATHAHAAQLAAVEAHFWASDPRPERRAASVDLMDKAAKEAGSALGCLQTVGIVPAPLQSKNAGPLDLSQLATLDSPDARTLLALLDQAATVAERLDIAQGNAFDAELIGPHEARGTNWSELLHAVAARLRNDIEGPQGRE